MPRSGEGARRRLQKAALELWSKRGYEATTAAQIAARAGVTERTFFRHFPDKREVLFDGSREMREILIGALAGAPPSLPPLSALLHAFSALEPMFELNRSYSDLRQKIIARTPALRERELAKFAELTTEVAKGLQHRGVEHQLAILAAEIGRAAFEHAVSSWIADQDKSLTMALNRAFSQLHDLVSLCDRTRSGRRNSVAGAKIKPLK